MCCSQLRVLLPGAAFLNFSLRKSLSPVRALGLLQHEMFQTRKATPKGGGVENEAAGVGVRLPTIVLALMVRCHQMCSVAGRRHDLILYFAGALVK